MQDKPRTPQEIERVDDLCEAFYKEYWERNCLKRGMKEEIGEDKVAMERFEKLVASNPEKYSIPLEDQKYKYTRIVKNSIRRAQEWRTDFSPRSRPKSKNEIKIESQRKTIRHVLNRLYDLEALVSKMKDNIKISEKNIEEGE